MKKYILQISVLTAILSLPAFAQDLKIASTGQMYIAPTAFVHASSSVSVDAGGELIMDSMSTDFSDLFIVGTSTGNVEYRRFTGVLCYKRLSVSSCEAVKRLLTLQLLTTVK